MSSGGARGRSGSAPDPNSLRRAPPSGGDGWVRLPAEGGVGDPPPWPLSGQSERESQLWVSEWARPQAVQWEAPGAVLEVALYVRRLVEAEKPDAAPNRGTLVKELVE